MFDSRIGFKFQQNIFVKSTPLPLRQKIFFSAHKLLKTVIYILHEIFIGMLSLVRKFKSNFFLHPFEYLRHFMLTTPLNIGHLI